MNESVITVHALFVGQRINVLMLKYEKLSTINPIICSAGKQGFVVIFRYGVVVFINLTKLEQKDWLHDAAGAIVEAHEDVESEYIEVIAGRQQEGFVAGRLNLNEFTTEKMQLLAFVLAKAVVLSYYEKKTSSLFDRIEPLANDLQKSGRGYRRDRELLQHIGSVLSIQSKMVGRAEVAEKPDVLWEFPQMERLFQLIESEYEIRERHQALEKKFELIARTVTTLLNLLQYRRTIRVEWYIVILIVIDILVSLAEKYL